jgi:mycothiol synthase
VLPTGYTARPPVMDEAAIVTELENERWRRDTGADGTILARTLMWWHESTRDMSIDNIVVISPSGEIVAYADFSPDDAFTKCWFEWAVSTQHRGLGIEEYLYEWVIERTRQHAQSAPTATELILEATIMEPDVEEQERVRRAGFEQTRVWHRMQIEMQAQPPEPTWPEGISVRTARADEIDAVHEAWEDAQSDEWGFTSLTDEEFRYYFAEKEEGLDLTLWFLAIDDASGQIVGYVISRWERPGEPEIGQIRYVAVRAPFRRKGIARALLLHAFGEFYRRGKRAVNLSVDATSLTGADRLYTSVGMRAVQTTLTFERRV